MEKDEERVIAEEGKIQRKNKKSKSGQSNGQKRPTKTTTNMKKKRTTKQ